MSGAVRLFAAVCLCAASAAADVVVENARMRLVLGDDAVARSLVVKATGEEMLDVHERLPAFAAVQDRPFNNEIKLVYPNRETTFRANRVRREGDDLIVGFELVSYEAKIRVTERDGYVLFELVDFILGPKGTDHLKMTYPPVRTLRFLGLPVRNRTHAGDWMNSVWDDRSAVALMAGEPFTWIDGERRDGFRLLVAEARRGLRIRGAKAALVAAPTGEFLDCVDAMERELGLPRGVESRRSKDIARATYWTADISPTNVDEHIAYAKRGGFRKMLIMFVALCDGAEGDREYGGIGDYEILPEYPKGLESVREMLAKIRAAGITPGLHVLQTFIGLKSRYVTPVADPRLNLTRHFTLAKPLGTEGGDVFVQEDPSDCPTNVESRVLRFGGELMTYEDFVPERPFRFTGVRRGYCRTHVVPHERGLIGGILDVCEYGGVSCYIDQRSDLQDEIAEKIARIYDCGFEFMYCDGSEGVNVPQGIHVANAQYRVWKKLGAKPRYMEGAAKAHFAWHHLSAANAFDRFHPEIFKEMIVRWPLYESPILAADFSRPDYGWWGVYVPGERQELRQGVTEIGTQPDMWEFGMSRAVAWGASASVQMRLENVRRHPRLGDLLEVVRRWEDVRERGWLTAAQREALKSPTQEHHLYVNEKGNYELYPIRMLPTPAAAPNLRGFVFTRGGRRTVAYWHTRAGELAVTLPLGGDGAARTLVADGVRYVETDLPVDAVCRAFAAAAAVAPDEVKLVADGVARCRVVVAADASAPERFGAEELATYLDKATGCGALNGEYPICIRVKEDPALREDGFAIEVTPEKTTVVGANPRGALYGCYEILKRFAGVRWLVPGDDGEYVPQTKTVAAPVGRIVRNPYLRIREARCDDELPGRYWLVRNNMLSTARKDAFFGKDGNLSDTGRLYEKLTVRGTGATGHLMSTMLLGSNRREDAERLFAAHPEYFPLVNGERRMIWTPRDPNPCVSNPAVLDVMAANLAKWLGGEHGSEAYCEIGNNDTTIWCQCAACRALDPKETAGTRGELSDRYWWFVNELARRVWAKVPQARICGSPYQNFWFAPVRVKPDSRLYCYISFNNQCWRHSVGDPKCSVNRTMREIYEGFRKFDLQLVFNRDEIGAWDGIGSPGCEFQPAESVYAQNMLDYPAIACRGSHLCVHAPCPEYSGFAKDWAPYYGKRYHWYAMWQTCYVASLLMFDPTTDWKAELEHANRLFYGAAWKGGMKEFRALLTKCFLEAPGCIGWGQHAPMGRCLDAAGSEEKLKALLDQAVAAAKESGDARALKHVLREKEIFGLTWLVQRKKYLENFKELSAYRRTGEITVDGVLDEADWKNADAVSDFQVKPGERADVQSYVRVLYDKETLYVAVEAMEPTPERILAPIPASDALHGLGDRLEIFYNYPDMADRAYHLCVNSKGACVAARQNSTSDRATFETAAKVATKVGKDRWTLELAIPCSEIGQNCFDGASWKLNVARERLVEGMSCTSSSSCCKGHFHGPANFLNVKFAPARAKGIGQNHTASSWNNPGFDANHRLDPRDKARFKGYVGEDDREPDGWNVMDVTGEYHRKDGSKDDWYMTLRHAPGNNVRQYFMLGDAAKLKAIFRARGRGRLRLWTCSFVLTPDGKDYNADGKTQKTFFYDLTDDWRTFTAVVEKKALPTDRVAFWFCADKDSVVDLDDAVVTRIE